MASLFLLRSIHRRGGGVHLSRKTPLEIRSPRGGAWRDPGESKMENVDSAMMPINEYVEVRNGAYYVAGTRIGLDVVIREFRDGRSPEEIFDAYASIGSL